MLVALGAGAGTLGLSKWAFAAPALPLGPAAGALGAASAGQTSSGTSFLGASLLLLAVGGTFRPWRSSRRALAGDWVRPRPNCIHPEREDPNLCGNCPRNGVRAVAAFVSSAKASCVHPDRKPPRLCGDCPRDRPAAGLPCSELLESAAEDSVSAFFVSTGKGSAVASFVSSAKASCVHPDRKPPRLCGDCPRDRRVEDFPLCDLRDFTESSEVCSAASFTSSKKFSCVHPDRKPPNLCGDCPNDPRRCAAAVVLPP